MQEPVPPARRRRLARRRVAGLAFSVGAHVLVLAFLMWSPQPPPNPPEPPAISVALVDESVLAVPAASVAPAPPAPAPAATPQPAPAPAPAKPVPRPTMVKPRPEPTRAERLAAEDAPASGAGSILSEAQLAGAASAGGGGGEAGGPCDMAGRLQAVLRRDPLVQAAVARIAGKSYRVWDGSWVWMQGDIGQGFTAVRQAMEWEIAYAPAACRAKPMHGLVVFSLNEGHGPVRLAVGSGDWRWNDLVTARGLGPRAGAEE